MLDLNDKTILVSLRKIDKDGEQTFDTFFGTVVSFNENTVRVLRTSSDEISLPYDEEIFELAEPGFYELKDGSTFENPSFTARWTVFASKEASIKFRKKNEAAVGQG
jgi:RNase P/RNase MRP subunit p29